MVKVGKRDLKVKDARKILTSYNRLYKSEEFGKRGKGGMGVYRMGTAKLEQEMKMFKVSRDGKSIKHKTNVKFDYKLSDVPESLGKVAKSKSKPAPKKKQKKQTKKDKADESAGMSGQDKGTTSKSAPKNFEKKKKEKKKVDKSKVKKKAPSKATNKKVFTAKNGRKYVKNEKGQVRFIKN